MGFGAGANCSCVSTLKDVFPSLEPVTRGPLLRRCKPSCKPMPNDPVTPGLTLNRSRASRFK
jgi:hypothetical protein